MTNIANRIMPMMKKNISVSFTQFILPVLVSSRDQAKEFLVYRPCQRNNNDPEYQVIEEQEKSGKKVVVEIGVVHIICASGLKIPKAIFRRSKEAVWLK